MSISQKNFICPTSGKWPPSVGNQSGTLLWGLGQAPLRPRASLSPSCPVDPLIFSSPAFFSLIWWCCSPATLAACGRRWKCLNKIIRIAITSTIIYIYWFIHVLFFIYIFPPLGAKVFSIYIFTSKLERLFTFYNAQRRLFQITRSPTLFTQPTGVYFVKKDGLLDRSCLRPHFFRTTLGESKAAPPLDIFGSQQLIKSWGFGWLKNFNMFNMSV